MSLFLKLLLCTLLGVASGSSRPYACWLPASVLHTHIVEPHYWESYNGGGDYKNPEYVGFQRPIQTASLARFGKINKAVPLADWKILAYPPGTVAWGRTAGNDPNRLFTIMTNDPTGVCRTNDTAYDEYLGFHQVPVFTHTGRRTICNGKKEFEALVRTEKGVNVELEQQILGFGPYPDAKPCTPEILGLPEIKKIKENSDAAIKAHGKSNGKKPNLVRNHCWSAWTSKTQRHPGHPIGHLGARSFHLIRLICPTTRKISFGTLILSEKKAVVFGPKNSNPIKPIIQVLTSHDTPIKWIKTNQTSFIHQTLKNWLIVGRHLGNPYESSTKRKDISYGICRPNLKMFQKKKDSLVGIANSDSGFCKVYFGGQAIYFTKFYIGVASRKSDKLECTDEIELCPGTVHQSVDDPTTKGLFGSVFRNSPKTSDKGNSSVNIGDYHSHHGTEKSSKMAAEGRNSASFSESGEYNSTSQASVESEESLEFLYDDDDN